MSLFITQCPHCNTAFRTSISQLQSADGMVRCGACLRVFAADDNLLPSVDLCTIETPVQDDVSEEDDFDVAEEQLAMEVFEPEPPEDEQDDTVESIFTLDMADSLPNRLSPHISTDEPSFWQLIEENQISPPEEEASIAAISEPDTVVGGCEVIDASDETDSNVFATDEEMSIEAPISPTESSAALREIPLEDEVGIRSRIAAIDFDDEILNNNSEHKSYTRFSAAEIEGVSSAETPLELTWMAEPERRNGLVLYSLGFLLILSLASQYLWFNKDTLSQNPRFRGGLEAACEFLSCTLPPLVDLGAIHSDTLVVRSHSEIANALSVNFQFRNDAKFPQPFPGLSLRFTDADDQLVAERRFAPAEYLPQGVADLGAMPPGSPVQVRLDILDPGMKAINYEISFYPNLSRLL